MNGVAALSSDLQSHIEAAYLQACLSELDALKPGNVHRYSDGHGMTLEDFVSSAYASVKPLMTPTLGLGERVYRAVEATQAAVGCNTNLGILMLCAPLIQAMYDERNAKASLRDRLHKVLRHADEEDTSWLFDAIRLAAPGGLGNSSKYDVSQPPTGQLVEIMAHAAERDLIARQYATGYEILFDFALPKLRDFEQRWQSKGWPITALFLSLLSRFPDTHIQRKHGLYKAVVSSLHAAELAKRLSQTDKPEHYHLRLLQADNEFKRKGINPGTSADMTVATLFIAHLESMLPSFEQKTGFSRKRDSQLNEVGSEVNSL